MVNFRSYDAFAKPVQGLKQNTAIGGAITLIASTSAMILFLLQLYLYVRPEGRQSLHLADSITSPMSPSYATMHHARKYLFPIQIKVTFPHLRCDDIDVAHDDARGDEFDKLHKHSALSKTIPTRRDLFVIDHDFIKNGIKPDNGCTVSGELLVPKVGGTFSINLSLMKWKQIQLSELFHSATKKIIHGPEDYEDDIDWAPKHNVSHFIHEMTFGNPFPYADNPLQNHFFSFKNIGLSSVHVKIIPTKYKSSILPAQNMHQISVTQHTVQAQTFLGNVALKPGLSVVYDFSPIMVKHEGGRDNLFTFITSLIIIVGGVFVTVELLTGILIEGAAAVAKKID